MNETEKKALELLRSLPPLQAYSKPNDPHFVQVTPLYVKDLGPEKINELKNKLDVLGKLIEQLADEQASTDEE